MVPKAVKLYGCHFSTGRGVTQGDLLSLTIFNIVVDSVVRAALLEFFGPKDAQYGFGCAVGEHNIWF